MAIFSADVQGLDELIRAVAKLPEEALKEVEGASIVSGDKILQAARANVPVSKSGKQYYGKGYNKGKKEWNHAPGLLRDNIKLKKPGKNRKKKYLISASVGFGNGTAYGVPLELGHDLVLFGRRTGKRVEGRPFLRNAADDNKNYAITAMVSGLNSALEKFSK